MFIDNNSILSIVNNVFMAIIPLSYNDDNLMRWSYYTPKTNLFLFYNHLIILMCSRPKNQFDR